MKIPENLTGRRVLVIGGNGGIGKQCIRAALQAGCYVTAILRTPAKLAMHHSNLNIVQGDISYPEQIIPHLANKDAVISAVGVSGGLLNDEPTTLYSDSAQLIVKGLGTALTTHAFFISASAVEIRPVLPFYVRFIARFVLQKLLKHMYSDLLRMEDIVKQSSINYTVIRPPQLTDGKETGSYRIAINQFLPNGLKISRADVAHFIMNHIDDAKVRRTTVEIGY
ncbi:NAD(P)-dependent oxidoreductase [Mucilaginibacter sp. L3T2-6]|uniref:NAD(P)-dependent oxidoreductase n=1 Tax=Mucilaginibacter sp. L3T2-6 TaxID=3062491 RepID=UPI002675B62A|nr:NAD(P)H-binding protein [Mucilaginibacter sp. L3T2-6]MDO3642806.1 NAD(P)H-binding protein [Mucilaginibacter sp. L3T2-6]MDV6215455.1 NAD(P)H-binding protein [Mucilaginibacter sp. L3T2-6]